MQSGAPADCWQGPELFGDHGAGAMTSGALPGDDAGRDDAVDEQARREDADERLAQLARAIELEIIPRLMLAHRAGRDHPLSPDLIGEAITSADVESFADLVLSDNQDLALARAEAMIARGVAVERIFLELLAPAARHLGDLWDQDVCDFTAVTMGLGLLQRLVRELCPLLGIDGDRPASGRRVLLLPGPGEQHTFGLMMVGEFFRRAGWDVVGGASQGADDAAGIVGGEWFDVVGFSLAAEVHFDALRECIREVRRLACNPAVCVMVGGPQFVAHPEQVAVVGADAMALDGRQAPVLAEQLLAHGIRRC
jgi:methanogenic corrinoid protein MtbC1